MRADIGRRSAPFAPDCKHRQMTPPRKTTPTTTTATMLSIESACRRLVGVALTSPSSLGREVSSVCICFSLPFAPGRRPLVARGSGCGNGAARRPGGQQVAPDWPGWTGRILRAAGPPCFGGGGRRKEALRRRLVSGLGRKRHSDPAERAARPLTRERPTSAFQSGPAEPASGAPCKW